ncbi:hypothetical protein ACFLUH_00790 [Chloroflexota bacterium]
MVTNYKEPTNVTAKVSFDLPFCLYLRDGDYEVQVANYKATVSTKQKKHKHIDERLFIKETTSEIRHDRYGRIRYTSLEINIPLCAVAERDTKKRIADKELEAQDDGLVHIEIDIEDLCEKYIQPAIEEVLDVINFFLAIYREITSNFWVRTLSRDDISKATIEWYEDNELLCGGLTLSYGKKGISLEPYVNQTFETQLRERLKLNFKPSIVKELALNARDYLELDNYRMSLIESRTCIEVIIDRLLLGYFQHRKLGVDEIKKVLKVKENVKCKSISDVLQQAYLNTKLKNGLKVVLGHSLAEDRDLWKRWLKLKTNRESAIHSATSIPEIDAIDGVNTLMDIIDFVNKYLNHVK